jgi:hypothetical protein
MPSANAGNRDARHRERHAQAIGPAVAPDRGQGSDHHADRDRPRHRRHGQPERRQEALCDLRADGALGAQRLAEVAVQHAARVSDELFGQRLVEPQVLAHQRHGLRRGVRTRGQARRVAGQQMHEHEHQHGDDQQRRKKAEQALD